MVLADKSINPTSNNISICLYLQCRCQLSTNN